jgi:hypothetical protein
MEIPVATRVYLGSGSIGARRLANLKILAMRYFGGSLSKLFNDAVNKVYMLHPETGQELTEKEFMVADQVSKPPSYPRKPSKRKKK